MKAYPFIIQGTNITVVIDNKVHTIASSHPTFARVREAIRTGDWAEVKKLADPRKAVINYGKGNIKIVEDTLYWKGEVLHNALSKRILAMLQEGFEIDPMVNFMDNLMQNPSRRAVEELYGFLEKNDLPITPDGCFLAYKKVRDNYKDVHSGTFDNSVGKTCEMPRNRVDDDKDRTCSTGLHFCSHSYLAHFGGERVVILKINPRDVVSIPSDYNNAKGRTCRYEVIGEVGVTPDDGKEFLAPVQTNATSNGGKVAPKPAAKPAVKTVPAPTSAWPFPTGPNFPAVPDDKVVTKPTTKPVAAVDNSGRYRDPNTGRFAPRPVVATPADPKEGKTDFFRGYSAGYAGRRVYGVPSDNFSDGYKKGKADGLLGVAPRYKYVK